MADNVLRLRLPLLRSIRILRTSLVNVSGPQRPCVALPSHDPRGSGNRAIIVHNSCTRRTNLLALIGRRAVPQLPKSLRHASFSRPQHDDSNIASDSEPGVVLRLLMSCLLRTEYRIQDTGYLPMYVYFYQLRCPPRRHRYPCPPARYNILIRAYIYYCRLDIHTNAGCSRFLGPDPDPPSPETDICCGTQ